MADTGTAELCVAACKLCTGLGATPLSAGYANLDSFRKASDNHRQAVAGALQLTVRIAGALRTPPDAEERPPLEPLFHEAARVHPPARPHVYHNYWPYLRSSHLRLLNSLECTDHELVCWSRYDGFLWGSLQADWERFARRDGQGATAAQCPPVEYVLSRRLLRFWTVGLAVCLCQWAARLQRSLRPPVDDSDSDEGGGRKRARPDETLPQPVLEGGLTPDTIDRLLHMGFPGSLAMAIPADHAGAAAAGPVGGAADAHQAAADVAARADRAHVSSDGQSWWPTSIEHLDELVASGTVLPSMLCWTEGTPCELGTRPAGGRTWESYRRGWSSILDFASSPCSEAHPRRNDASLDEIANVLDKSSWWDAAAEPIRGTPYERAAFVQAWQDGVRTLSHLCQRALVTMRFELARQLPPLVQAVQQHELLSRANPLGPRVRLAWWTGRYDVRQMQSFSQLEVTLGPLLAAVKEGRPQSPYLKGLLEEWCLHCPSDSEHLVLLGTLRQQHGLERSCAGSYDCLGCSFTYTTRDGDPSRDDIGCYDDSSTRDTAGTFLLDVCANARRLADRGVAVTAANAFRATTSRLPAGMCFLGGMGSSGAVAMHLCISVNGAADGRFRVRGLYADETTRRVWSADGYLHATTLVVRVAADWEAWSTHVCSSVLGGDWQPSPPPLSVAALNNITTADRRALTDVALSGLHELPSCASAAVARCHSVHDMCAAVFSSGTTVRSVREALLRGGTACVGALHADFAELKEPFHELSRALAVAASPPSVMAEFVDADGTVGALRWVACHCDALLECYVRAAVTASAFEQLSGGAGQLFCHLEKICALEPACPATAVQQQLTALRQCMAALGLVAEVENLGSFLRSDEDAGDSARALDELRNCDGDWASMLSTGHVQNSIRQAGARVAADAREAIATLVSSAMTLTNLAERAYLHAVTCLSLHQRTGMIATTLPLFRYQCSHSVLAPLLASANQLGPWTPFTVGVYAALAEEDDGVHFDLNSVLSAAGALKLLRANSRRGEPVVPSPAAFGGFSVGATSAAEMKVTQAKRVVACERFTAAPTVADAVLLYRVRGGRSLLPVAPGSSSAADDACLGVIARYVAACREGIETGNAAQHLAAAVL